MGHVDARVESALGCVSIIARSSANTRSRAARASFARDRAKKNARERKIFSSATRERSRMTHRDGFARWRDDGEKPNIKKVKKPRKKRSTSSSYSSFS
jgi:hypothetical protein